MWHAFRSTWRFTAQYDLKWSFSNLIVDHEIAKSRITVQCNTWFCLTCNPSVSWGSISHWHRWYHADVNDDLQWMNTHLDMFQGELYTQSHDPLSYRWAMVTWSTAGCIVEHNRITAYSLDPLLGPIHTNQPGHALPQTMPLKLGKIWDKTGHWLGSHTMKA